MKIHVLGDSISLQYGPYLQQYLAGVMDYARKEGETEALLNLDNPQGANGGDSAMVLSFVKALAAAGGIDADLLLVNCGLHDIKRNRETGQAQVAIADYESNLRAFHSDRDELGDTTLAYEHVAMKAWHPELEDAVAFLRLVTDPTRQPVLVHCQHGADRTGTMCALYRMVVQGWTKEEALREMREGGYGFHEVWKNLPAWIEQLAVKHLQKKSTPEEHAGARRYTAPCA